MHFCHSWFSSMVSFRYVLVFLKFFVFVWCVTKYFLILLNFTRYPFSVNTIFLLMKNVRNECWVLKQKYFVKVCHVSWNRPETVFYEMPWKKNFTVYPSLYTLSETRVGILSILSNPISKFFDMRFNFFGILRGILNLWLKAWINSLRF